MSETTLRHLLREQELPRAAGCEWYFCPDPGCDIVYITADGETLTKGALPVRVGLKESTPPRPLCYCFGYDVEDVEREAAFGSQAYAAEELVAEMGSAFLCAHLGIQGRLRHPEYIGHWLKVLKDDKRAVFKASSLAQAAADFVLGADDEAPESSDADPSAEVLP